MHHRRMERGQVVADVMLGNPKTLDADARVSEVRPLLARPSVQIVLLVEGPRLAGVITDLPPDAADEDPALDFAEARPDTIGPDESASTALDRTAAAPHRRLVVVDDRQHLLGLLCLDESRTRFCGSPGPAQ